MSSCSPPLMKAPPAPCEAAARAWPRRGPFEAEPEPLTALTGWGGGLARSGCRMGPQGSVLGWSQGSSCPPWPPATVLGLQGGLECQDGVQRHAPGDMLGTPPGPGLGAKHRGWTRGTAGAWLPQCDGHGHAACAGLAVGAPSMPHICPVGPGVGTLGGQPELGARGGLRGLSAGQVRAPLLQAEGRTQPGE